MLLFVVFSGLDWVATVPPTVALCREHFGAEGTVVFGWVFASHQVGAALAATAAGLVRTELGSYDLAWIAAGACAWAPPACHWHCGRRPSRWRRPPEGLTALPRVDVVTAPVLGLRSVGPRR